MPQLSIATTQGLPSSNQTGTSVANTPQTITIPAVASLRIVVRKVALYSSAAGTATLVVQDNGVTKYDLGSVTTAVEAKQYDVALASASFNQAMQVVVGAGGAAVTTTVSVIADYVSA